MMSVLHDLMTKTYDFDDLTKEAWSLAKDTMRDQWSSRLEERMMATNGTCDPDLIYTI